MEDKKYETLSQEVREIKTLFCEFVKGVSESNQEKVEQNKQQDKLMKQVNELLDLSYENAMQQIKQEKLKQNYFLDIASDSNSFENVYNTINKFVVRYKLSNEEQDELYGVVSDTTNVVCEGLAKLRDVEIVLR